MSFLNSLTGLSVALLLVLLNGFFVAVEFGLVKIRTGQLRKMVSQRKPFAKMALWLAERMDQSLSACQLGITMASLALGWVGESAFHDLLQPVFGYLQISEAVSHVASFVVSFSFITAAHLVLGEQVPKIYAIRRPDRILIWCALPMKFCYYLLYPFHTTLSVATSWLLLRLGVGDNAGHDTPVSEEEIRSMLTEAHSQGELTRSEHNLISAVFEFDDLVCRRVMLPRSDVVFFETDNSLPECIAIAKRTKHTRYPLCDGSLDNTVGIVHIKDLTGIASDNSKFDIKSVMRPPHKIPESMPISRVLRHFQATHQLLALVQDEHGTTVGIVTLENVLERIVGPVDDEFDTPETPVVPIGNGQFIVQGSTPIELVEKQLGIELAADDVDTVSGVLMTLAEKIAAPGDIIEFENATAKILEVRDGRAMKIRFTIRPDTQPRSSQNHPS